MSIFNLENYFYINQNSLSKELCNDIINYFEIEETGKYEGNTGGGLRKDIKMKKINLIGTKFVIY
jgi:hypothetical protein